MRHYVKLESAVESVETLARLYRVTITEEIPGVDSEVEVKIDERKIV